MGLESRDYFRDGSYTSSLVDWGVDFTPVVKYLIIVNVIVFVAQIFFVRGSPNKSYTPPAPPADLKQKQFEINEAQREVMKARQAIKKANPEDLPALKADLKDREKELTDLEADLQELLEEYQNEVKELIRDGFPTMRASIVQEWGELSPEKTAKQGQLWRLVTCMFLHSRWAVWHILMNMLMLYWFGTRLERMYGSREFLLFYLAAGISSSVAYVALALYTNANVPAIGASGAVMGVMMLYTIFYPWERIYVFWVIPVPLCILLGMYVIYDLHPVLLSLAGDQVFTGVAHAGHLGGLAFGLAYWKLGMRLERLFGKRWHGTQRMPRTKPNVYRKKAILPYPDSSESIQREDFTTRVDEVLKKISEKGKESLTVEERDLLVQASERLRRKK